MNKPISDIICEIEDTLCVAKEFDVYDRCAYYNLLRHTLIENTETITISLQKLADNLRISDWQARKTLRSLEEKGCLQLERSRLGHIICLRTPEQIGIRKAAAREKETSIEDLDFYESRRYVNQILKRENGKCFYCLKELTCDHVALDHVSAQVSGGKNTYKNIVAACHDCNSRKQGITADDFFRMQYRRGILSEAELAERLAILSDLRDGLLIPKIS